MPTTMEYDKEEFITVLKEHISYYGLNLSLSISDSDRNVHNMTDNSHLFNLDSVIAEHELRLAMIT